jgi:hypothetical protein
MVYNVPTVMFLLDVAEVQLRKLKEEAENNPVVKTEDVD